MRRAAADLNVPQYHDVDAKYRLQARSLGCWGWGGVRSRSRPARCVQRGLNIPPWGVLPTRTMHTRGALPPPLSPVLEQLIQLKTTEMANNDLDKYHKASAVCMPAHLPCCCCRWLCRDASMCCVPGPMRPYALDANRRTHPCRRWSERCCRSTRPRCVCAGGARMPARWVSSQVDHCGG